MHAAYFTGFSEVRAFVFEPVVNWAIVTVIWAILIVIWAIVIVIWAIVIVIRWVVEGTSIDFFSIIKSNRALRVMLIL